MSVEVINVTRTFRGAPAVRGLSVSVPSGAVTGLVGPNGAGKTTLLLMLAALLRPDTGTIRVNGLDPVTQPREVHRVVGWMPDSFGTWDSLTCTEILQTFAVAQGVETREASGRAAQMLAVVHLEDMAAAPARVLSRGQKQRLGLARALIHYPSVLLLDEPAAGMDPRSRADLRQLLRSLADGGVTVLISSHVLGELEEMIDGAVFVSRGQALRTGEEAEAPARTAAPYGLGQGSGASSSSSDAAGSAPPGTAPAEPSAGSASEGASPGQPGLPAIGVPPVPTVVPVRPTSVRTVWRMRILPGEDSHAAMRAWSQGDRTPLKEEDPESFRLTVPDQAAACAILGEAVRAGVKVVSFAPVTGLLEETYLSMEEERR